MIPANSQRNMNRFNLLKAWAKTMCAVAALTINIAQIAKLALDVFLEFYRLQTRSGFSAFKALVDSQGDKYLN